MTEITGKAVRQHPIFFVAAFCIALLGVFAWLGDSQAASVYLPTNGISDVTILPVSGGTHTVVSISKSGRTITQSSEHDGTVLAQTAIDSSISDPIMVLADRILQFAYVVCEAGEILEYDAALNATRIVYQSVGAEFRDLSIDANRVLFLWDTANARVLRLDVATGSTSSVIVPPNTTSLAVNHGGNCLAILVSNEVGGLGRVSILDPSDLSLLGNVQIGPGGRDVTVVSNRVYVAHEPKKGLPAIKVIDFEGIVTDRVIKSTSSSVKLVHLG